MSNPSRQTDDIWLAAGIRTPFAKVDGPLSGVDAIAMSVPVVKHMIGLLAGGKPDFAVWGNVVPNLTWSNIAREILMDAGWRPRHGRVASGGLTVTAECLRCEITVDQITAGIDGFIRDELLD